MVKRLLPDSLSTGLLAAPALLFVPPGQTQIPLVNTVLGFLANPNVAYLLFVLGLLGLVAEIVTAGTAVPGTIGAICLILGLAGLGQLPTNWAGAVLILLAVVMFLLDIKVPGHALSIGGVIAFVLGSLLILPLAWFGAGAPVAITLSPWVIVATTVGLAAFFFLGVSAALRLVGQPAAVGRETMIGKLGQVRQDLAPEGIVHVEGEEWSAISDDGEAILRGAHVRVVATEGLRLRVQAVPSLDLSA